MFSRIVNDSYPERQGLFLEKVGTLVTEGRLRPILTTRLEELTVASMKLAHELIEKQRTVGKIVVAA